MTGSRMTVEAKRSAHDGSLGSPAGVCPDVFGSLARDVAVPRTSPRRLGWGIEVWPHAR